MRVEKICIQNFRGIEELKINLNPKFNLLIGDNGTGKTAILEALTVGIGAFFLGIPGTSSRNIRDEDIRYFKTIEGSSELAKKTHIFIEAIYNNEKIGWFKERKGITGKTLYPHNSIIKSISQDIDKKIKDPKRTEFLELQVLVYYSTSRLWKEVEKIRNQKNQMLAIFPPDIGDTKMHYKPSQHSQLCQIGLNKKFFQLLQRRIFISVRMC